MSAEVSAATDLPNVGARRYALWDLALFGIGLLEFGFWVMVSTGTRRLIAAVMAAVLAVGGLTFWVRGRRSGVTFTDDGVTARRRNRTRRLQWNEIERFELKRSMRLWLVALRPDGRTVRIQTYRDRYEADAVSAVSFLNDELQGRRTPA